MTKQIREYLDYLEGFFATEHTNEEYMTQRELMLKRIALYQHERLIHLLVTLAFGVFFLLGLMMYLIVGGVGLMLLSILFLGLLVPYIKHYYFLENSVQKIYTYYYKIER